MTSNQCANVLGDIGLKSTQLIRCIEFRVCDNVNIYGIEVWYHKKLLKEIQKNGDRKRKNLIQVFSILKYWIR